MTSIETERIVRKIAEFLAHGGGEEMAPKLASDYSAACRAANLRLRQCEGMVKAGDSHQAIQLAETQPALLDLVTVLEFAGADAWRAFCQQNSLDIAERIDARSVQTLNDCYAKGITTDHPLYSAYRKAVLGRNDDEALKALQSISRLNPSDTNATSELQRLDAKVLNAKIQALQPLLASGDDRRVTQAVEAVENFGFKSKPTGDVWKKAQAARCGVLIEGAERARETGNWQEAISLVEQVKRLKSDLALRLAPGLEPRLSEAEQWSNGQAQKDKQDREFGSLQGKLRELVRRSEEKDTSSRFVKLPELREDFDSLHKVWRALLDLARPLPIELAGSFKKRAALLEGEIARRTAVRRRIIFAASTVAVAIVALIVFVAAQRAKAREFADGLDKAVTDRLPTAAEKLIELSRREARGLAGASAVGGALTKAEAFVAKERGLLSNYESLFSKLPSRFDGELNSETVSAIARTAGETAKALAELASDFKSEAEPKFEGWRAQWREKLAASAAGLNQKLEKHVSAAERSAGGLDFKAPLADAAPSLRILASEMKSIDEMENGFTNYVAIRSDLIQRASVVRAKFSAFDREAKKIEDGLASLGKAKTFAEHDAASAAIASSEFSNTPSVAAAKATRARGISEEAFLRNLLSMTNSAEWAHLLKPNPARLMPSATMPAERTMFTALNNDPAVRGDHRYLRLWLDADRRTYMDWIASEPLSTNSGWKKINAWNVVPTATRAAFAEQDYGFFEGKFRLSATQPVYGVQQLRMCDETLAFNSVGMVKTWGPNDSFGKPVLQILSELKQSNQGSPLFRAYFFLRLMEMMKLQPEGWGVAYCPAARNHEAEIGRIAGTIHSGDWFLPAKTNVSQKLARFFETSERVNYVKQAAGLAALYSSLAADGVAYAGHVSGDGVVHAENARTEVFVLRKGKPTKGANKESGADPLTPVFALQKPLKDYFAAARIAPDDVEFRDYLPEALR